MSWDGYMSIFEHKLDLVNKDQVKNVFKHKKRKLSESKSLTEMLKKHKKEEESSDSGQGTVTPDEDVAAGNSEANSDGGLRLQDDGEILEDLSDVELLMSDNDETDAEEQAKKAPKSSMKASIVNPDFEEIISDEEWNF
jgi:hypothetical protein